ncbi:hypothetical protein L7F22_028506, partial [Adiantum nelumboides]|nr:hypothetical protein [Adiantum nelumboides]
MGARPREPVPVALSRDEEPHISGPWGSQRPVNPTARGTWGSARPWGSEPAVGFNQHRGVPRPAVGFSAPPLLPIGISIRVVQVPRRFAGPCPIVRNYKGSGARLRRERGGPRSEGRV